MSKSDLTAHILKQHMDLSRYRESIKYRLWPSWAVMYPRLNGVVGMDVHPQKKARGNRY